MTEGNLLNAALLFLTLQLRCQRSRLRKDDYHHHHLYPTTTTTKTITTVVLVVIIWPLLWYPPRRKFLSHFPPSHSPLHCHHLFCLLSFISNVMKDVSGKNWLNLISRIFFKSSYFFFLESRADWIISVQGKMLSGISRVFVLWWEEIRCSRFIPLP